MSINKGQGKAKGKQKHLSVNILLDKGIKQYLYSDCWSTPRNTSLTCNTYMNC